MHKRRSIDLKQKETELLIEYRDEIDSLYQQRPINHEQIDKTQSKIDLIEQRSLKGAMVRSRTQMYKKPRNPFKILLRSKNCFPKTQNHHSLKRQTWEESHNRPRHLTNSKDFLRRPVSKGSDKQTRTR